MFKKCLQKTTILWLIIALVGFHPVLAEEHCQHTVSTSGFPHTDNTLFDAVMHHLFGGKKTNEHQHHKAISKARVAVSRSGDINLLMVSFNDLFILSNKVVELNFSEFKFWENRAFLPPHHNFLFRLSPF